MTAPDNHPDIPGNEGIRIRTKSNHLPPDIDREYLAIIHKLRIGSLDVDGYHRVCLEYFSRKLDEGAFSHLAVRARAQDEEFELLRRHLDEKRYTVILYKVNEGQVHPPHHHFNVVSTQIVVEGALRLREFDRVRREDDGTLVLKLASDRILKPGDWFQASEWKRNVHWFQAIDGSALIFNTNARGFEASTFDEDSGSFGRRYIDPTCYDDEGLIVCEEFDKPEALVRFDGKSLDSFEIPPFVTTE